MSTRFAARLVQACLADCRGVAAVEFALISSVLVFLALNVADAAYYAALRMQVENAAQAGAQAAWQNCLAIPATTKCSGFAQDVKMAVQSTSLGNGVALQSGSPAEGYYCVGSSGTLSYVGAVTGAKPADCGSVGVTSNRPGDWVSVQVIYSFTSLLPGLTITTTMPSTLTKTAWMRLG